MSDQARREKYLEALATEWLRENPNDYASVKGLTSLLKSVHAQGRQGGFAECREASLAESKRLGEQWGHARKPTSDADKHWMRGYDAASRQIASAISALQPSEGESNGS